MSYHDNLHEKWRLQKQMYCETKKKQTLNAVYNHIMWLSDDIKIKKEIPWIIKWVNILKFYSQKTSVKITQI